MESCCWTTTCTLKPMPPTSMSRSVITLAPLSTAFLPWLDCLWLEILDAKQRKDAASGSFLCPVGQRAAQPATTEEDHLIILPQPPAKLHVSATFGFEPECPDTTCRLLSSSTCQPRRGPTPTTTAASCQTPPSAQAPTVWATPTSRSSKLFFYSSMRTFKCCHCFHLTESDASSQVPSSEGHALQPSCPF